MAEDFTSPIGVRSDTSPDTWSITVNGDGDFVLRSNSPVGEGQPRFTIEDDSGLVTIGSSNDPAVLRVIQTAHLVDSEGTDRVRLSAQNQRLEVMNEDGEIIEMIGGSANIRAGSNGENGDLFLYPRAATDIFANGDATVRLNGSNGNMTLGGNGTGGDVFLRDGQDTTRARLSARNQRLEVMNEDGDIIGMIGGSANIRAGSNGLNGDLFLFSSGATDIFANGDATVRLNGSNGNMTLGGNGTGGDVFLRDGQDTTRARLSARNQRLEVMNEDGDIIGMIGGSANIRAGSNGLNGDLFLFSSGATDIFANDDATVRLNGSNGNMTLGGNGTGGDVFLRDGQGTTRARLSGPGQRLEVMNENGEIIGMIGGGGNIRAGTNGEGGNLFLYPDTATDIFDNGQATIRMGGNSGDIVLQNADFAEDFDIATSESATAQPGAVMVLRDDGTLERCTQAYDSRVVGVISGAGGYKPAIVMDKHDDDGNRVPVALVGKIYCRVDAAHGPIAIGDLLTTSFTEGCAMKAADRARAFGAVLGKALAPHSQGIGLIPVLVNLQ